MLASGGDFSEPILQGGLPGWFDKPVWLPLKRKHVPLR